MGINAFKGILKCAVGLGAVAWGYDEIFNNGSIRGSLFGYEYDGTKNDIENLPDEKATDYEQSRAKYFSAMDKNDTSVSVQTPEKPQAHPWVKSEASLMLDSLEIKKIKKHNKTQSNLVVKQKENVDSDTTKIENVSGVESEEQLEGLGISQENNYTEYKAKKGDSPWKIARKTLGRGKKSSVYQAYVNKIIALNELKYESDGKHVLIKIDQTIKLPNI